MIAEVVFMCCFFTYYVKWPHIQGVGWGGDIRMSHHSYEKEASNFKISLYREHLTEHKE